MEKNDEKYFSTRSSNNELDNLFSVETKKKALNQDLNKENSFAFQWKRFCREAENLIRIILIQNFFISLLTLLGKIYSASSFICL
jgi:hypothetical protein